MIAVVYGTTGELIKLAPLLLRLRERKAPAVTLCTGQQATQLSEFTADFGLPEPDVWLARGRGSRDLERLTDVPLWLASLARSFVRERGRLRAQLCADSRLPVVLVHGDTMTTVIGAVMGRSLGALTGHVEAGLRSGSWRDPFPEELDRRAAAKLVRLHLAPGAEAVANLRAERARGQIVDTGDNTIYDSLSLAAAQVPELPVRVPSEPFGLVSLHRFELLENGRSFRAVLDVLREHSRRQPLLMIDHTVTAATIQAHGLDGYFDDRMRRIPRLRYTQFISLLKQSQFLVTDSGGSQEECAFLGHPCLVHRAVSERSTGLGRSVVLSEMKREVVRAFLAAPERHRYLPLRLGTSPTDVILAELERVGGLAPLVPVKIPVRGGM